jgi:protein-tyrosine kinase
MATVINSWVTKISEPLVSGWVRQGKLAQDELAEILKYRIERNISFNSAAVELGILTPNDVAEALGQQRNMLPKAGDYALSPELAIAYDTSLHRAEVLRKLRYQLAVRWFAFQAPCKSLAVVSSGGGDGKSRLAAELAIVFAQAGERTLLVDADLRSPRQHELFGLSNDAGLTSMHGDIALLAGALPVHAVENLFVVPSGPLPDASRSLLVLRRLEGMLKVASADFDVIILDTPPLNQYVDAQTIALAAGGALFCVRRNEVHVDRLREHVGMLQSIGVNVVGSTFNSF